MNKFTVVDPNTNEPAFMLNESLMIRQGKLHNLEAIKAVHQTKLEIHELIRVTTDKQLLRSYGQDLTLCEFELQKLWGFPEDIAFHRFWETPKCTCPKFDNEERYGTKYSVVALMCPIHGTDA
jgi:hypothetical protein